MPKFAHTLIEVTFPDGEKVRYDRGDQLPKNIDKVEEYDELVEGNHIRDEEYDPAQDAPEPPKTVEIDGFKYIREDTLDA
jgi:hypothetical protein